MKVIQYLTVILCVFLLAACDNAEKSGKEPERSEAREGMTEYTPTDTDPFKHSY